MFDRRRYVRAQLWRETTLPVYLGVAVLALAVSCMFLTSALFSDTPFLLYTPLLAAGLLIVGGSYEKSAAPRALAWVLALIVMALTGLVAAIGTATMNDGRIGVNLLICGGLLLIPAGITGFMLWQAWRAYRTAVADSRLQILVDLVQFRGDVSFDEIAEELNSTAAHAAELAEQAIADGALAGLVDAQYRRVYSLGGLAKKQAQLGSVVQARGQMSMQDLSQELQTPEALIKTWLYQLVRRGHFSGYVDWDQQIVYSRQRGALTAQNSCPNCTAALNLAGQGIIGCQYCGAEIFL